MNESATVESLGLAVPLLKLVERQGNQEEKLLNAEISNLIGKRLHEFDIMGAEVVWSQNYYSGIPLRGHPLKIKTQS